MHMLPMNLSHVRNKLIQIPNVFVGTILQSPIPYHFLAQKNLLAAY